MSEDDQRPKHPNGPPNPRDSKAPERRRKPWQIWAHKILWIGCAAIILLLFVQFGLGINFIAWIAGDPLGNIWSWMQEIEDRARIKDSFEALRDMVIQKIVPEDT